MDAYAKWADGWSKVIAEASVPQVRYEERQARNWVTARLDYALIAIAGASWIAVMRPPCPSSGTNFHPSWGLHRWASPTDIATAYLPLSVLQATCCCACMARTRSGRQRARRACRTRLSRRLPAWTTTLGPPRSRCALTHRRTLAETGRRECSASAGGLLYCVAWPKHVDVP